MKDKKRLPLVVLISGSGSNLQAIIDGAAGDLPVEIHAVISNREDAYGLERAKQADIETHVLNHKAFNNRESYDQALGDLVESFDPGLVVLAGFMRILTPGFVKRFHGRLFNIHPSLLPKFQGLHTHQRAIDEGETEHGASIHFVTEELDGGPIVLQITVPVEPDDDADTLGTRVLTQEHVIFPTAIRWFAEGRLKMDHNRAYKDGQPLDAPVTMRYQEEPPA